MLEEVFEFLHWGSFIPNFMAKYDFYLEFGIGAYCILFNYLNIKEHFRKEEQLKDVRQKANSLKEDNDILKQGENAIWKKIQIHFEKWNFTEKEKEIASLILRGLSNKQIAGYLSKSVRTVENQIQTLFGKTGFSSKNEFMAFFFEPFLPEED